MSSAPICILVVEDSESDFDLLALRLERDGLSVQMERVEDEPAMRTALEGGYWDLVICDHKLPRFSMAGALRTLRAHDPDIPLIVVSGAIGEEAAVDAMLAGADDFIVKGNYLRLQPAIRRSIDAAVTRRRQRQAEEALRESEALLRSLAAHLPGMVFRLSYDLSQRRFSLPYVGEGARRIFGLDPQVLRQGPEQLYGLIAEDARAAFAEHLAQAARSGADLHWEGGAVPAEDGGRRWLQVRATLREHEQQRTLWDGIVFDITDAKRAEAEIRELRAHLEEVKEADRAAVAREIHDDIGAIFFALKVDLAWLRRRAAEEPTVRERLDSIAAQLESGIQASQRIVRSLRPAVLDFGVVGAAEWLARDFAKRTGISCAFSSGVEEVALAPELGTALFRVLQESLTNISRHAHASAIDIVFEVCDGEVRLEVKDNGQGLRPDDLNKRTSFGVRGMRERARDLGGALEIGPGEPVGTRLRLRLPLRLAAAPALEARGA